MVKFLVEPMSASISPACVCQGCYGQGCDQSCEFSVSPPPPPPTCPTKGVCWTKSNCTVNALPQGIY